MSDPSMSDPMNAARATREGTLEDRTLIVERVFRAPPEKVFQAWTDPDILTKWWGPTGATIPECDLDAKPGGTWRTVMATPDGNRMTVSGVFREIAPPDRLVMTWAWQQDDGSRGHETEIVVTFEDVPEGTRLRLVQSVFENVENRDMHGMGWNSTFDDLDRLFA